MESNLSLQEFRVRLKNNTEIGSTATGTVRIFPISGVVKPFYGFFDDTSFRLTVNSPKSTTPFIVKGNYREFNNKVRVDYVVEAGNKFEVIWAKYAPILLILAINVFFLFFARGLRRASTLVNLFLLFMAFYSRWKEERKRKKLEQKFIQIFRIIE